MHAVHMYVCTLLMNNTTLDIQVGRCVDNPLLKALTQLDQHAKLSSIRNDF